MTAPNVRRALIRHQGYRPGELPSQRTIARVLNRLGFRLRRVQKTKPAKKIQETDAIFENVARANREADEDPTCLRISIDSKAKVKIGPFSRRGRSRGEEPVRAEDHDMNAKAKLALFGILEIGEALLTVSTTLG